MKVTESKDYVRRNKDCRMTHEIGPDGWYWFVNTPEKNYPRADTEGKAWKLAALAIKEENDRS